MEIVKFSLIGLLLACGCQSQEEIVDLDQAVQVEDELDFSQIAGDPIPSPQEFLIKEPATVE